MQGVVTSLVPMPPQLGKHSSQGLVLQRAGANLTQAAVPLPHFLGQECTEARKWGGSHNALEETPEECEQ